jgi:hypothetical protein
MNITVAIGIGALVIGLAAPVPATAACCHHPRPCCESTLAPCCDGDVDALTAEVLPPIGPQITGPPIHVMFPEPAPVRRTMTVSFTRPTRIGNRILFGKYIIEHDNLRMAKGRPCTHIYEADDPRLPVVRFHCTHLKQEPGTTASITLRSLHEANGLRELVAFQFAGENGAHGVPGH